MSAQQRRFVFLSAISGNIMEYYDFTVYSVFAVALGKVFFPSNSEFVQMLASLAVFAVGFITRPLGGIVFGYIGDRYGRRVSLICSMLGMTITTFAMGMIPGYATIGIAAPIVLVVMRLVQGLCISGEGAGAAIFVLEHYGNLRPGLVTGIVQGSNITGTLLASLVGIVINSYFLHIEESWRFAFMLGGIMGIAGFYLRLRTQETPIFKILARKKQVLKAPFFDVVKTAWHYMLLTGIVAGVASSIVYLIKTYVAVFYSGILHLDTRTSLMYLSYATFILMIVMPLTGWLSDYIGRKRTLQIAAVLNIIFIIPVMQCMTSDGYVNHIIGLTLIGILGGLSSGSAYIFTISLFDPKERFTGVAFSYNFGVAIFGGTAPMIATSLVGLTDVLYSPGYYIMALSIVFLIFTVVMRESINKRFI
jgi:MFS transporter, MHS family, proline/betaine transporter